MGLVVGTWVVGLVGVAEQDMIVKEVDANRGIDLDGQASLGCINPLDSS